MPGNRLTPALLFACFLGGIALISIGVFGERTNDIAIVFSAGESIPEGVADVEVMIESISLTTKEGEAIAMPITQYHASLRELSESGDSISIFDGTVPTHEYRSLTITIPHVLIHGEGGSVTRAILPYGTLTLPIEQSLPEEGSTLIEISFDALGSLIMSQTGAFVVLPSVMFEIIENASFSGAPGEPISVISGTVRQSTMYYTNLAGEIGTEFMIPDGFGISFENGEPIFMPLPKSAEDEQSPFDSANNVPQGTGLMPQ